ncbi:MAG: redoxin domain-containing protein [Chloroflexi bacterium]|nr:redoxin domain-containing protein [Chloroflexota bacterium]
MVSDVNIGLAFLAGLVSFISPCVLPLVPAYVGYMGGRATNEAGKEGRNQFGTFLHGVSFVLGFTLFFVGFGLMTAAASSFLTGIGIDIPIVLTRLGGLAIILFGLYVMKLLDPVFRWLNRFINTWENDTVTPLVFSGLVSLVMLSYFFWAFGAQPISAVLAVVMYLLVLALFRKPLNTATSVTDFWKKAVNSLQFALATDTRKFNNMGGAREGVGGYAGSLGMGVVFAAGWTPCIGPVFGAVLIAASDAAANGDSLVGPGAMLTAYSLGLGIPFLLTALAFNQSVGLMNRIKRNMRTVELVSGVLLIFIGILVLSGGLTDLSARFGSDGELGELSIRIEGCTASAAEGRIALGDYPGCVSGGIDKLEDRFIIAANKGAVGDVAKFIFEDIDNLDEIPVGLEVGQRAPDFEIDTLDGETLQLSDLRGQAVLVNFWATWCGPCRTEMPEFQTVYEREREKGFTIVAVDFRESPEQVRPFVEEFGMTFNIGLDESGEINRQYRVSSYPTNYLIDGNGIIVMKRSGAINGQVLAEELNKFENTATEDTVAKFEFDDVDNLEDIPVGLEVGNRAPDFGVPSLDGDVLQLSDMQGQAVLVNFWATWCGPCQAEMPELEAVYELQQEKGFTVLAVNFGESPEQIGPFVDEFELTFNVGLDQNGEINKQYRVTGWPTSFLIDGNGIIARVHQGELEGQMLSEWLDEFEPSAKADGIAFAAQ